MTPHDPARIESVLSAAAPIESALSTADVHLLLYAWIAVMVVVCVAACAVPVLDAVRRWVAR